MELKINVDTKTAAADMVRGMSHHLHMMMSAYVAQRFGALNPIPGVMPFQPYPGFPNPLPFPPPGHPYAQYGMPPPPFGIPPYPQQAYAPPQPQAGQPNDSAFQRAQQPGGNPNFTTPNQSEYAQLMDKLIGDEDLITRVEAILKARITEFMNTPAQPGTPQY